MAATDRAPRWGQTRRRARWALLVGGCLLAACGNSRPRPEPGPPDARASTTATPPSPGVVGVEAIAAFEALPERDRDALRQRRIFWAHMSLGNDVSAAAKRLGFELEYVGTRADYDAIRGRWGENTVPPNGDPRRKLEAFVDFLDARGIGTLVDAAAFKFCFADFEADSDAEAALALYDRTVQHLKGRFPTLRLLHVTPPLTTGRLADGREVPEDAARNAARWRIGRSMIARYGETGVVFDIATIESTDAEGRLCTTGGAPALCRTWAAPTPHRDEGHLSPAGADRAARAFVVALHRLLLERPGRGRPTSADAGSGLPSAPSGEARDGGGAADRPPSTDAGTTASAPPGPAGRRVVGVEGIAAFDQLSAERLASLARRRVFWGHMSIGFQMSRAARAMGFAIDTIGRARDFDAVRGWGENSTPPNGDPSGKIGEFVRYLEERGIGARAEAVALKLGYADFSAATDVSGLLAEYFGAVDRLRRAHPSLRFLHITPTLSSAVHASGRVLDGATRDNEARWRYARALVDRSPPGDVVFDLAAVLSVDARGQPCLAGGQRRLCPEWVQATPHHDEGHLSDAGASRAVRGLIYAFAVLLGSAG